MGRNGSFPLSGSPAWLEFCGVAFPLHHAVLHKKDPSDPNCIEIYTFSNNQNGFSCQTLGRLAAVNNEVILVTTSEAAHIDCCKLLDEMIFCTSLKIPDGLIEDDIIVESLSAIIKPHKLKYLALQLDVSRDFQLVDIGMGQIANRSGLT